MTKFPIEASITPLLATEGSSNEGNNERALFRAGIQYHIPIYQRGYAWGYDDVRNFARSLFDKPEEAGGAEEAKHIFFGTVQFDGGFDDNPKKLDVVDGQQRLFTFALYLGMLQDLAEIENAPLNVFDNAPEGFKQAMNPSAPYKDGWYDVTRARAKRKYQDDKNDRFLKNKRLLYLLFAERFKGDDLKEKARDCYCRAKDCVYFAELYTQKMPLSEVVGVFNTINTTGLDLNEKDTFKIALYSYLMKLKALHKSDGADDAGNKEAFMEEIDEMYASIKAVAEKWWQPENLGYMPWIDVGEPIRTYMYVVLSGLDSARNEDIRKGTESFFNEYFNRDLRQNEILEPENAWHEVHAAFESFRRFYNSVYVDSTKVCHDAKHLAVDLIWHTRYWSYWAVVPAFYHLNGNELDKALEDGLLLAKLLLVYSVINDKRVKEIDGEVLRYLRMQKEGKRDEYRAAVLNKLAGETKNRFKDQIAKNIYNNRKKAMNLLFLSAALDELWDGSSPQNIRYRIYYAYCGSQAKSESERKPSALDFDHIQPRSLGGDWDNELLNGLGNLVAIESSKNRSFNDALPNSKTKIDGYKGSNLKAARALAESGDLANWSKEKAKERRENEVRKILNFIYSENVEGSKDED